MGASVFYVNSNCGVERIFQQYALRRSLFYLVNLYFPPRHLIRRLTLGNAAGIFKDNLVPFGANAEGICPKRPLQAVPLRLKGEGIVAGTLYGMELIFPSSKVVRSNRNVV